MAHRTTLAVFAPIVLSIAAVTAAYASEPVQRHFQPAPPSPTQRVDNIDGVVVISSAGKLAQVGTAIRPLSAKQGALLVSVKNTGTAAVEFGVANVKVVSGDQALQIHDADEPADAQRDPLVRDRCANATSSSQVNCNIDQFNEQQRKRLGKDQAPATTAIQIAPNTVVPTQFRLDLPKKGKGAPLRLTVTVTVAGESQSFDFWEVD
jgi:hypothetical protein